jgi:hypothetical protein
MVVFLSTRPGSERLSIFKLFHNCNLARMLQLSVPQQIADAAPNTCAGDLDAYNRVKIVVATPFTDGCFP